MGGRPLRRDAVGPRQDRSRTCATTARRRPQRLARAARRRAAGRSRRRAGARPSLGAEHPGRRRRDPLPGRPRARPRRAAPEADDRALAGVVSGLPTQDAGPRPRTGASALGGGWPSLRPRWSRVALTLGGGERRRGARRRRDARLRARTRAPTRPRARLAQTALDGRDGRGEPRRRDPQLGGARSVREAWRCR